MRILKDAVYGFAVGDALGVPFEFQRRESFKCTDMVGDGTWNQVEGTWSDDTSMLLATCDSLKEHNAAIHLYDMMGKFEQWYTKSKYTAHNVRFDIGNTTAAALEQYLLGTAPVNCGLTDIFSNGNGSLMRILPLAFIPCNEDDIREVSSITHAHCLSKEACVIYVNIAKQLIQGESIQSILSNGSWKEPFERMGKLVQLSELDIKSSGYVIDTLEAALWSACTTDNYKDCVLKAVNLGEDTDTVAAIAGGIAGIMYGFEQIPSVWVDKLANKTLIDDCLF
ncbi:ADP-ribosylglycohydrolase family protein [Cytobacillus massiliigabonensis]|uniref:ADP-ribosylglycohydrolase family protein n=1 Tax=Cytobacillus massiliigabonensis TaxID=1871011 RepID=UPI000C86605F|nr:ADP-ribosylglycohydrolase family protein [Cytobacillus massiliigabonensis]